MMSSWRTLKLTEISPSELAEAPRPRKLVGTTESMKPIQEPVLDGSAAEDASMSVPEPGFMMTPTRMPTITEKNAVMTNQIRVLIARRAALATLRRFATEVMTAVMISGGTMVFSRET